MHGDTQHAEMAQHVEQRHGDTQHNIEMSQYLIQRHGDPQHAGMAQYLVHKQWGHTAYQNDSISSAEAWGRTA